MDQTPHVSGARFTLANVYNKYLISMLVEAKVDNPGLRQCLRSTGHKAIDPACPDHIEHASSALEADGQALRSALASEIDIASALRDDRALSFQPLKNVSMRDILGEGGTDRQLVLSSYLFTFAALSAAYAEGSDTLADRVLTVLAQAQQGIDPTSGEAAEECGILEDDIVALLVKVARQAAASSSASTDETAGGGDGNDPLDGLFKSMENSKIADMATEISKEIDLSGAGANPMELLNFEKLTDSSSVLGNIVSKVGGKIQSKLASGELNQGELMAEALGFLKAFDKMGSGGGGGAGGAGIGGGIGGLMEQVMRAAQQQQQQQQQPQQQRTSSGRSTFSERRDHLRRKLPTSSAPTPDAKL